jgi:DNA replication protein DnaC
MNPQLNAQLRHLRLSGIVEALAVRLEQARSAGLDYLEFLELLVQDELARRADRLFKRRLKQATITQLKELSDFDWTFNPKLPRARLCELATGRFVAEHTNVLLVGPPGVGKSHAAVAIAVGAIRSGYRVLLRSVFDLVQDFAEADAIGERRELVNKLSRIDLLILEDFSPVYEFSEEIAAGELPRWSESNITREIHLMLKSCLSCPSHR